MATSEARLTSIQCPVATTDDFDLDGPRKVGGVNVGAEPVGSGAQRRGGV